MGKKQISFVAHISKFGRKSGNRKAIIIPTAKLLDVIKKFGIDEVKIIIREL